MIKDKKYFFIALIPFFASMALNFPFPDVTPYGDTVVSVFNIPVQNVNGLNYVGITSFFLLIVSLYFLLKSLRKYHKRLVMIAIMIAIFTPPFLARSFQKTFATGIYAVTYDREKSNCSFEMINKTTLNGVCELPFENYSRNEIQFTIEFYDQNQDNLQMVSLMNNNLPYEVKLEGKESKKVKIEANIDVSKMENHIENGEATGVNITIKSGRSSREF
ncbi:hypothetical protein [Bacillus sp. X1(2014)]|uniref:hypothetical protein n=1 Tax=Bacillus sp. X1(2014) TaxID=1565991 RepID=UPI0011A816AE|nr:hypothetical protein [Bacillus sp. X1(2014)]